MIIFAPHGLAYPEITLNGTVTKIRSNEWGQMFQRGQSVLRIHLDTRDARRIISSAKLLFMDPEAQHLLNSNGITGVVGITPNQAVTQLLLRNGMEKFPDPDNRLAKESSSQLLDYQISQYVSHYPPPGELSLLRAAIIKPAEAGS